VLPTVVTKNVSLPRPVLSEAEGTARAQGTALCHFDRREKSFLDPSHSLGMTGLGPSPWRPLRLCARQFFPTSSSFQKSAIENRKLFYDLGRPIQQRLGNCNANLLGGFEIYHQREFRGLLDGKSEGLATLSILSTKYATRR
jgi:hypothetical protein